MKLTANRDAVTAARTASFRTATRGTYTVTDSGVACGTVEFEHAYPLAKIQPHFVGHGAWVARLDSGAVYAAQTISAIRAQLTRA